MTIAENNRNLITVNNGRNRSIRIILYQEDPTCNFARYFLLISLKM